MILYSMLTMTKREHKDKALNRTDSILMELILDVFSMLLIGEWISALSYQLGKSCVFFVHSQFL